MRVLVIGATGGSGRVVCDVLLHRGHRVTAFARSATAMLPRDGLDRVDGDAADVELLERVLLGRDAVVVTLGISEPAWRVRLLGAKGTAHDIRSRGTGAVVRAARRSGVSRIVVQSSYGVGPTRPHLEIAERLVFALLLKPQIADTERQEQVVRASGLEWTLVQAVYSPKRVRHPLHLDDGLTRPPGGRGVRRRGTLNCREAPTARHSVGLRMTPGVGQFGRWPSLACGVVFVLRVLDTELITFAWEQTARCCRAPSPGRSSRSCGFRRALPASAVSANGCFRHR